MPLEAQCEICKTTRYTTRLTSYTEDVSQSFHFKAGTMVRTIWHCEDNPDCVLGARQLILKEIEIWKGRVMANSVALDFDGTLATYLAWVDPTHIDAPFDGAAAFTQRLRALGLHIIIHSCRTNPELNGPGGVIAAKEAMIEWMDKHAIAYDEIWTNPGKPVASAYVDDRGVSCRPADNPQAYEMALEQVKFLANV